MKIADKTVDVKSNITFDESVAVTIDESAVSMVIERLISAYKNPYRAALREYTSNAYDEHVASGQTLPVEVSLPSSLSPVLKVQDFGRGLTREELKGFGTIGLSTKRDSNEFTGGFGMGSKCALAAASQFTVVSVKNGKRNTVIVARDEHNVPHMNFLPEAETTDDTGTTVIVPISDISKFGDLTDFFVGWKRGTILVDGEEPKRSVFDSHDFKTRGANVAYGDNLNVSSGQNMVRVLINQVYYSLEYRNLDLSYQQWSMLKYHIIRVDNGSVDIAPSREDLIYNARTKAALEARFNEVLSLSSQDMAKTVTDAPTLREALRIRQSMRGYGFPVEGIKWGGKGLVLPGETVKGNKVPNPEGTWATPHRDSKTKTGLRVERSWSTLGRVDVWQNEQRFHRFLIIHSAGGPAYYGVRGNRRAHREADGVAEYIQSVDPDGDYTWNVFITEESESRINRIYRELADSLIPASEFNRIVSNIRSKAKAEAKALEVSKKATRKVRVLASTDGYYGATIKEWEIGDLKNKYTHAVILRNLTNNPLDSHIRDILTTKKYYNGSQVHSIATLREKYKVAIILVNKGDDLSDYESILPTITTFEKLAMKELKGNVTKRSKLERLAMRDRGRYNLSTVRMIKDHHLKNIRNKDTRKWIAAVRDYQDTITPATSLYSWIGNYSEPVRNVLNGLTGTADEKLPESPYTNYPLLDSISTYNVPIPAVVEYINLIDAKNA